MSTKQHSALAAILKHNKFNVSRESFTVKTLMKINAPSEIN